MPQELNTIVAITIVYMQLFVRWHNADFYVVTHQEVPIYSLIYNIE